MTILLAPKNRIVQNKLRQIYQSRVGREGELP